ncbi:hypothetical protein COL922a_006386 [Colletotrichum nupharicola]|nr:hypothetical protein COL922a_006386 [Colletotrichum nupharicola]
MAKKSALAALKSTSLEWTAVYNGYFLDYFGTPKVKTYMDDVSFFVDVANNVAALLEKSKWPEETYIIGDKVTFHEMVRLAENVKGAKFTVAHDSIEDL